MRKLKREERMEAQENIEASMNHLREVIEKPERVERIPDNALLIPVKVEKKSPHKA